MNGIFLRRFYGYFIIALALLFFSDGRWDINKTSPTSSSSTTFSIPLYQPQSVYLKAAGVTISSKADLGETEIKVDRKSVTIDGQRSIQRTVGIHPKNDINLDAELVFQYEEQELNGLLEENLILYSSQDEGKTWTAHYNSVVDPINNTIQLTDIEHFSLWTAAPAPLPVLNEEGTTCPNALQTSEGASFDNAASGIFETGGSTCVLCDLDDTANLTDTDTTNSATLTLGAAVVITGGVEARVVINTATIPTGSTVGFVFESSAALSASVLAEISIQTYNGGMPVDDVSLNSALISASVLGSDLTQASIVTSGTIDEIRFVFDVDGLGLSLLTTYNIYYAFQNTPCVCLSPDALQESEGASINDTETSIQDNGGAAGACALCVVADEDELVNADTTDFATIAMVAAANYEGVVAVNTGSTIPSGSTVGFVFEDALGILSADLLSALYIRTYNGGVLVDDVPLDGALATVSLLNSTVNQASIVTTGDIDEIRFVINGDALVNLSIGVLKTFNVYYGFVEAPCGCECEDALQSPGTTVNNDNTGIDSDGGLISACVSCAVTDAGNLVNADTTDFANISIPVALSLTGNYEAVLALNTGPLPGGSKVGFVYEDAVGIIGADILTALRIRTLNDGNIVDDVAFTDDLIALQLLAGTDLQKAFITTSGGIDEIQFVVDIDALLGLASVNVLQSINVYYALQEFGCDNDNDGVPDDDDLDDDNDGIPDVVEAATAPMNGDTDGDGIPDILDLDSDNDGVTDLIEAGGTDTDGDGVADDLTDMDGDGLVDIYDDAPMNPDLAASTDDPVLPVPDSDSDGQPDFQDLDADNDTANDIVESGITDSDNNALVDERNADGTLSADADGDGLADSLDPNDNNIPGVGDGGGTPAVTTDPDANADGQPDDDDMDGTAYNGGDTDSDNALDLRDLDSDNDSINDIVENNNGDLDTNNDGYLNAGDTGFADTDNDGIADPADDDASVFGDAGGDAPNDTDGDTVPDFQDLDSDNDTVNDIDENGNTDLDTDNDGYLDSDDDNYADTDGDGIADPVDEDVNNFGDAGGTAPTDTEGDGVPDFQDLDADNDTVNDIDENGNTDQDSNNNGYLDSGDTNFGDMDSDGIADTADENPNQFGDAGSTGPRDTESDGVPDFQDLDSDNDTVNDIDENGSTDLDTNNNGYLDMGDTGYGDADEDGIATQTDGNDNVFGDVGGTGPNDTDGDGVPDSQDLDSDNDSVNDIVENGNGGQDDNNNGYLDNTDTGYDDMDGDGIATQSDGDDTVFGDINSMEPADTDNDNTPDFQDLDSDEDGTDDIDEAGNSDLDNDNDGTVDDTTDPDKDGIVGDADELPNTFGDSAGPDLSPVLKVVPNTIIGISNINITVRIQELNGPDTDGEIVVRIPKEARLTFTYNPSATSIGFDSVDNSDWTYDSSNIIFHIFRSTATIAGNGSSTFGFTASYDPQSTAGNTTITSTIASDSGGEVDPTNNSDSEQLSYSN